jgi:hypothetical protein
MMDEFNSETDSDYTSYWRDWVCSGDFLALFYLMGLFRVEKSGLRKGKSLDQFWPYFGNFAIRDVGVNVTPSARRIARTCFGCGGNSRGHSKRQADLHGAFPITKLHDRSDPRLR